VVTTLQGHVPRTLLGPLRASSAVDGSPALEALLSDVERLAAGDPAAAVAVLDEVTDGDREERAVRQAGAGLVLQDAGWLAGARERFAAATGSGSDPQTLAVAALGLGGTWVHEHRSTVDREQVLDLQRRALVGVPAESPVAVRLRVRLRVEQAYVAGDTDGFPELLEQVRAMDEPLVLAETLSTVHHCLLGPEHARERLSLAEELMAVSGRTGRRMDALLGLTWWTVDLFLAGDRHAGRALRDLRARADVDRAACVAYVVAALDVMLAIRAGALERAEQLAEQCFELGTRVGDADALGWYGAHIVAIRWYQGRAQEVLPMLEELADSPTMAEPNDAFTAGVAVAAAAAGRADRARGALDRLGAVGRPATRSSSNWLVTLFGMVEAADLLGDVEAARHAYELLTAYAGRPVMPSLAIACFGSVDRALGVAAGVWGDDDLAVAHLEAAHRADQALGNVPSALLASSRLAQALRRRARGDDLDRADALDGAVLQQGPALGMHVAPAPDRSELRCRRTGRDWEVSAGDHRVVVRHSLGMVYLDALIGNAGVELSAQDLTARYEATAATVGQDVLDATARAAYRRRIDELRVQIDEADDDADLERAARGRWELEQLLDELQRVTGLGGRSRAFADSAERARTSVQKAIRRAVAAVTEADPVLGRRLRQSVVTGTRCAYLPNGGPGP